MEGGVDRERGIIIPEESASEGIYTLDVEVEVLRAAGIEDDEIISLAWLKRRVDAGDCDDLTIEYKRLTFVKYLYDAGVIQN